MRRWAALLVAAGLTGCFGGGEPAPEERPTGGTPSWDEELAGKLQGQGLADCLGELRGQRVARVGDPTPDQRRGHTFVLEPLLAQDVLRETRDVREADAVLAADDAAAAAALETAPRGAVVVGGGATLEGVRNVVAGRQCLTLYENPERLAEAHGPVAPDVVVRETVADYMGEPGFPARSDVCAAPLDDACDELGL